MKVSTTGILAAAALGFACGDDGDVICTNIYRPGISVLVSSPEGLPIDRVSAENRFEEDCSNSGAEAAPVPSYACFEQGGGTYAIRVYSGELVWTRDLEVEERDDGCGVEPVELELSITAATAD